MHGCPASDFAVESDAAVSLDNMLADSVRGHPDVSALASIDDDKLCVLVWHYHDDDLRAPSAEVSLTVEDLPVTGPALTLRCFQIDAEHSNAYTAWRRMGEPPNPTREEYSETPAARATHGNRSAHNPARRRSV